jgi:CubicO group peptidase (beta-lactamase class C family)
MPRSLFLAALLILATGAGLRADDPKPAADKVLADFVQAYNEGAARRLHESLSAAFQKELPLDQLEKDVRQLRLKYGKITDAPSDAGADGRWHVYRAPGEKRALVLRLAVDEAGRLSGFQFLPPFRADLPAGPLTLEQVQQRLTAAVEETLSGYRLPSVSLALVKDDRVLWARAFGYQNVARQVPADVETVYVTGSIFKVVLATALLQFVDEDKLDLDAPVNGYLKDFQVPNPFEKDTPLTPRHLLSHHGGVPNGGRWVDLWKRDLPTPLEDLVRQKVKVTTRPGEKFEYSNLGFALNGYRVGRLAETSFEQAMKQRLLGPLAMEHTEFVPTPRMEENLAIPYQGSLDGKGLVPVSRVRFDVYPVGDVYATPADLAHFLILHVNGGKYGGKQVLSAKAVEEMARPQFAKGDAKSGPGLGWFLSASGGRRLLFHNGAVPGFCSYLVAEPDRHQGLVLFTNKFNALEAALGVFVDPLDDLGDLALELLTGLDTPGTGAKP